MRKKSLFMAAAFVMSIAVLVGCESNVTYRQSSDDNQKQIATPVLTGNIFLDAEVKSFISSDGGGGIIQTIVVNKEDAQAASEDDYAEFISERLKSSYAEAFVLLFGDGTGVLYYGCDPSNAVYGAVDYEGALLEGYGFIFPNDDGTYSYKEYTE